ncbi:MAG: D-aminoacyl-tRNA deacylase [Endomicrobiia bacterium]
MKAVIQRVKYASVSYNNVFEEISKGIVVFLAVAQNDTQEDINYLIKKILNLRIFENETGKMDKSVLDINGEVLIVSEFTLYGDCSGGNRPDFTFAAKPDYAEKLYNYFVEQIKEVIGEKLKTGKFKEHMIVEIHNDGPVTIILESKK